MGNKFYLVITVIHIIFWIAMYQFRDKKSKKQKKIDAFDPFYLITGLYFMVFVIAPWIWIDRGQTSYQGIAIIKYLPRQRLSLILDILLIVVDVCFIKKRLWRK